VPREGELPTQNVQNAEALVQNQCIGVSRGGRSTKIHVAVDALGNPIRVFLTSGEVHDSKVAKILLDPIEIAGSTVLADKAYGAYELREYIANRDADFCIPPKSNESDPWYVDWSHYKERALVENFFLKIKEYRRIAMRFEKLAVRYLAFVHMACALIWLK
jgi:transposase